MNAEPATAPRFFTIQSTFGSTRPAEASRILALALALGFWGNFLFRGQPPGLNVLLFLLAFCAIAAGLHRAAYPVHWQTRLALLVPTAFAACLAWRASPFLNALAILSIFICMGLVLPGASALKPVWLALSQQVERALIAAANAIAGVPLLIFRDSRWGSSNSSWKTAASVLVGLLISAPFLAIFIALFSSADALFAAQIERLFAWNMEWLVENLFWICALSWLSAGALRTLVASQRSAWKSLPAPKTRGSIEILVFLGCLNLLFFSFVLFQLRYLFGGDPVVQLTPGLTYAEYARRGFFELVAAAALLLPILLATDWLYPRERNSTPLRIAILSLVVLLFVIMLSAAKRMQLYQAEFGLTELRFYVSAFMLLLFLVFLWFAATVPRGRRDQFASGAVMLALTSVLILHAINPDAWIARINLRRLAEGKTFDPDYLAHLSADATPALLRHMHEIPASTRETLRTRLNKRASKPSNWRSWNWSREQAANALR